MPAHPHPHAHAAHAAYATCNPAAFFLSFEQTKLEDIARGGSVEVSCNETLLARLPRPLRCAVSHRLTRANPSPRRASQLPHANVRLNVRDPSDDVTLTRACSRPYFEHGNGVLDAACSDICSWPAPDTPGLLKLPLLENEIKVCVPKLSIGYQVPVELALPNQALVASLCAVDLGAALRPVLPQVQLLWELMLTASLTTLSHHTLPTKICSRTSMGG